MESIPLGAGRFPSAIVADQVNAPGYIRQRNFSNQGIFLI